MTKTLYFTPRMRYQECKEFLGVTLPGEEIVLKWLMNRDKQRMLILLELEKVQLKYGLIQVKCRTRQSCYSFSVSNINSKGWNEGMSFEDKKSYIERDLEHKME